jgi:hypothetical protein
MAGMQCLLFRITNKTACGRLLWKKPKKEIRFYVPQPAVLPALVPPPKPDVVAAAERVWLHSAGAVVNASQIACFTASGDLSGLTTTPFITSVGEPCTPYSVLSSLSTLYCGKQ